ncbi:MAG: hypothetical protein QOJ84_3412, partial [Bradyrhizobium sp.]|nr:hypothetical protein [Bradyrhizobium sp.]
RREIAVLRPQGRQVPGSADQDLKIVAVERPRGVSVASAFLSREASCGTNYLRRAFRRSTSLLSLRGRLSETPTHANEFAGGDDACPGEGAQQCAPTLSPSSPRRWGPIPSVLVMSKVSACAATPCPTIAAGGYGSPPSRGRQGSPLSRGRLFFAGTTASRDALRENHIGQQTRLRHGLIIERRLVFA